MAEIPINSINNDLFAQLKREEVLFVADEPKIRFIPLIITGLIVFAFVYWLSYDFRWSAIKTVLLSVIVLLGSFALVVGIKALLSRLFGKYPLGILITEDAVVISKDRSLSWFLLTDLLNVDLKHQYKGRNYESTVITLQFPDENNSFLVNDLNKAEDFVDTTIELKNKALARSVSHTSETNSDVISNFKSLVARPLLSQRILVGGATLVISAFVLSSAVFMNIYFDDSLSWEKAVNANTPSSYREYIHNLPSGRFKTDASARLKVFYDEAETRYRSLIGSEYDENAVSAIVALLQHARETHEYQVKVDFERTANVPSDLIDQLKTEFEVNNVLPLGTAFTNEKMMARETELLLHIRNAFQKVFQNDVLEIVESCSNACPQLKVKYETSFLETIYYNVKEEKIKYEDRNWIPGILIEWLFELNITEGKQNYSFDLESAPAEDIFYDTEAEVTDLSNPSDADQNSFYNAMVSSAFEDFSAHLVFNLGLGPEPHLDDEKKKEEEKDPKAEKKLSDTDTK